MRLVCIKLVSGCLFVILLGVFRNLLNPVWGPFI